jgi:sortase A
MRFPGIVRVASDAPNDRRARRWRLGERLAWTVGITLIGVWSALHLDRVVNGRREMDQFAAARAVPKPVPSVAGPDLRLWSPERIAAWQTAVRDPGPAPLAILRIPGIHLEVPVLEGTDDITLNRGAGHIDDTPRPGTDGNSGIAAHRDGFFRALKDVGLGDVIELETAGAIETYRIERTWIVDPNDVSVLDPTPTRALTLVTCYPFYFVGSAPKRFIVRAVIAPRNSAGRKESGRE